MKVVNSCCAIFLSIGALASAHAAALSDQFQPLLTLPTNQQAIGIAVGDVTGDGRVDAVVSGCACAPNTLSELYVFAGLPNGTLSTVPTTYFVNGSGSVSIGDVTGDGLQDVVLPTVGGIEVYPQTNNGALGAPIFYATAYNGFTRVGDLNGDGRADVFGLTNSIDGVTDAADGGVLYQNTLGALNAPTVVSAPHGANDDVELADVNGDGRLDVVVMNGFGTTPNISILYQSLSGTLITPLALQIAPGVVAHALGVGDVNGDGRKDIVATYGGYTSDAHIAVFYQNAGGKFPAATLLNTIDATGPIDVADVNNDGRNDVVVLHGGSLGVLLQNTDGSLAAEDNSVVIPAYVAHFQHALAITDLNGDGLNDVAFGNIFSGALMVLNGKSTNQAPIAKPDSASVRRGSTGSICVLANDSDPDGDAISISAVTQPANGRVSSSADGKSVSYTASKTFKGTEQFTYSITDGHGNSATATVTVFVK